MPLSENSIQLFTSIKQWVQPTFEAIGKRMDDFDVRLKAIPQPQKGDKGDPGESIQGEPGPAGENGVSVVDINVVGDSLRLKLNDDAEKEVKLLMPAGPKGEPGKDADMQAIFETVRNEVASAVSAIPPAQAGKDADPEFIRSEVARAVSEIPKAKDGEPGKNGDNADPELVRLEVRNQFEAMCDEFCEGLAVD